MKMLDKWESFTEGTNFVAWAHCILRNEFLNHMRRGKVRREEAIENYEPMLKDNSAAADQVCFVSELEKMINIIPIDQREIVRSICVDGLTYEEAALDLGVSVGTIKSRLWRSRSRLELLLGL